MDESFPGSSIDRTLLLHHRNKTILKLVLKEAWFLNKLSYKSIKTGTRYHLFTARSQEEGDGFGSADHVGC